MKRPAIVFGFLFAFFPSTSISQEENTSSVSIEADTLPHVQESTQQIQVQQHRPEQYDSHGGEYVDLSGEEVESLREESSAHVLARPWYRNIEISGFIGAGFLDTGKRGTRPEGGFLIKEASLFLEADVWTDATFYVEVQANRLGEDSTLSIRTGEVYVHFRHILSKRGDGLLGMKVGRIDIPFGEEYLWQDASDNPLISNSAPYPYGWDEGILLYGGISGVRWILAIADGTLKRSIEDHPSKAVNLKVYGNLWERFYLSASLMGNGMSGRSAIEFGGSHFEPVGANHKSSSGSSSNEKVRANLYEIDAKYDLGEFPQHSYILSSFGRAFLKDREETFSREWSWFSIEPSFRITQESYVVARYSEIGTYSSQEGYHFDGKTTAGGGAFGYDTKRFRRLSLGWGWRPNPRLMVKVEIGRDWYYLIDSSPFDPGNGDRNLFGIELAAVF
ncbi:MAG: hypothetical protein ACE5HZ_05410 [Fidelibacterota bacterium]